MQKYTRSIRKMVGGTRLAKNVAGLSENRTPVNLRLRPNVQCLERRFGGAKKTVRLLMLDQSKLNSITY